VGSLINIVVDDSSAPSRAEAVVNVSVDTEKAAGQG
jgi:hypothetical protein